MQAHHAAPACLVCAVSPGRVRKAVTLPSQQPFLGKCFAGLERKSDTGWLLAHWFIPT